MFDIGRLCLKIAGRDAGKKCIIIDKINERLVLIDGQTRRRKCNIFHLEPLSETVEIQKNASHEDVVSTLNKLNIKCDPVKEAKKPTTRPKKSHKKKEKVLKEKKPKTKKEKTTKEEKSVKPEPTPEVKTKVENPVTEETPLNNIESPKTE